MSDFLIALSTIDTEPEATRIAKALVEGRLAACVNILPQVKSVYEWKEEVCEESEYLLIIKTSQARVEELKAAFEELHPYEVPELVFLPVIDGLPDYLQWILTNTK